MAKKAVRKVVPKKADPEPGTDTDTADEAHIVRGARVPCR
jgi:hypothetical protein